VSAAKTASGSLERIQWVWGYLFLVVGAGDSGNMDGVVIADFYDPVVV